MDSASMLNGRPEIAMKRMYFACMPNIQIRDVSIPVHEALVRKAELAGQSLQQFLSNQLAILAATPSLEELLDSIEQQDLGKLSTADALQAISGERARR